MDLNRGTNRISRLFAVYSLAVALACLMAPEINPFLAGVLSFAHILISAVLLRRGQVADPDHRRSLILPYIGWVAAWLELGWLIEQFGNHFHDSGIIVADASILGTHWHIRLPQLLTGNGTGEAMGLIYLSYYFMILGPPLLLAVTGRNQECANYTYAIMATYLACFAIYLHYPVLGPRAAAAIAGAEVSSGGLTAIVETALRQAGDSLGTAFPSSHCAGSMAAALAAGSTLGARRRYALVIWALLITLSTVHTGNHYGLDAGAGVLLAVCVYAAVVFVPRLAITRPKEGLSCSRS